MKIYCTFNIIHADLFLMLKEYATKLDATEMTVDDDGKITMYQNNECICYKQDITLRQLLS